MRLLLAILIALVCLHYTRFYQGREWAWLFVILWIPIGLNIAWAGLGLLYRLDRMPFKRLELGLEEDQVPPGGCFRLGVRLEPRRDGRLRELSVRLLCEHKKLVDGHRITQTLHTIEVPVIQELAFTPGESVDKKFSVDVPDGAPYSYRSMDSRIVWTLAILVEVADWGRLEEPVGVVVGPV